MATESVLSAFSDATDTTTYRTREIFTLTSPGTGQLPDRRGLHLGGRQRPRLADPQGARAGGQRLARRGQRAGRATTPVSSPATSCATRCARCTASPPGYAGSSSSPTTRCPPGWTPSTAGSPWSAIGRSSATPGGCRRSTRRPSSPGCTASRGSREHFLYLNDDVFLGHPVTPDLFFTPGGLTRFFPSNAVVDSAPIDAERPPG